MPRRRALGRAVLRRAALVVIVCISLAAVVAFQATRPVTKRGGNPHPFVPEAKFYEEFSPSYRTSIADVYWLGIIQYYGEHIKGDGRLDSLGAMLDLVTTLSPRFKRPYLFGSLALTDVAAPPNQPGKWVQAGYDLLKRGFHANPGDWHFPVQLGFFAYNYGGSGAKKYLVAAYWYERARKIPGRPDYVPTIIAALRAKGGERSTAVLLWAQIYGQGDKYSRQKALKALDTLLPIDKQARMKAVAKLKPYMSARRFDQLILGLFKAYL